MLISVILFDKMIMLGGEKMSKTISDQAKEARRKYIRDWQRNNKEKMKQYMANYWEKKAAEMRANKKGE